VSDLMNNANGPQDDEVRLSGGQLASMQMVQQIYKEVTGKTERISRQFNAGHRTNFDDIANLHATIGQLLEQYHVIANNCNVTIFRIDDSSDRFSSIDRASIHEAGSNIPVENVRLEYEFLIVLPIAKKPESYKAVIDIHSRAALTKKMEDSAYLQRRIFSALSSSTGQATVEYVDYAVARTLMTAISQWFDSRDEAKLPAAVKLAKRFSHNFPWLFKYSVAAVASLIFYWHLSDKMAPLSGGYAIASLATILVASGLAYQLGDLLENAVDSFHPESYLNLTKGDQRIIREQSSVARSRWFKVITSFVGAIAVNLAANYIAKYFDA
jgi:hypothetical protein